MTGKPFPRMLRVRQVFPVSAPVDLDAIAVSLQRISQLATDYPEIAELDINPLIAGPVGMEPYVADARMTLSNIGNASQNHEHH